MATLICGGETPILEDRSYTDAEFMSAVRAYKKRGGFLCSLGKLSKPTQCPSVNDKEAWIKYLGLTYRTPADCRRVTAKRNKTRNLETTLWGKRERCMKTRCAATQRKQAIAQKQYEQTLNKTCGKIKKLTRRHVHTYWDCASKIDRSDVAAAGQESDDFMKKHCGSEQRAIEKYLNQ